MRVKLKTICLCVLLFEFYGEFLRISFDWCFLFSQIEKRENMVLLEIMNNGQTYFSFFWS